MNLRDDFCRSTWQPRPLREIPASRLDNAWAWWSGMKTRTKEAGSRCLSDTLMAWYYSSGAKCVHEHEGPWDDPNAPYYGGMQADAYFEAAYGPEYVLKYGGKIVTDANGHKFASGGHANLWQPIEQIEMAYNGWQARGWYPWPNTARACGLL